MRNRALFKILFSMGWISIFLSAFEYYTPKVVHLKNKKIGVLNRFIQLCIILYVVGYAVYWKKGYQSFSKIESSSIAKLKGIAYPNFTEREYNPIVRPEISLYQRVWDAADYSVIPLQDNAFFVLTNVIISPNQNLGECAESYKIPGAICKNDSDCPVGHSLPTGNGIFTGSCIVSDWDVNYNVCQVNAWCPVEKNIDPLLGHKAILVESKHFTVLIKNYVAFPLFNIKLRNIPDTKEFSMNCSYKENHLCPIFVLKDIVPGNYDEIAVKGATVAVEIEWDCDFDYDASLCFPTYQFRRLDVGSKVAVGQNFRFAHYHSDSSRTLYKAYGIRFVIFTLGRGGKFNVVPLLLNLGSGLGLLAVTTVVCDLIVLYCVRRREYYYHKKYQEVSDPHAASTTRYNENEDDDDNEYPTTSFAGKPTKAASSESVAISSD